MPYILRIVSAIILPPSSCFSCQIASGTDGVTFTLTAYQISVKEKMKNVHKKVKIVHWFRTRIACPESSVCIETKNVSFFREKKRRGGCGMLRARGRQQPACALHARAAERKPGRRCKQQRLPGRSGYLVFCAQLPHEMQMRLNMPRISSMDVAAFCAPALSRTMRP